jgi:hypothetical protein
MHVEKRERAPCFMRMRTCMECSKTWAEGFRRNRVEVPSKRPAAWESVVRAPPCLEPGMEGAAEEAAEDTMDTDRLPTILEPQGDSAEITELQHAH